MNALFFEHNRQRLIKSTNGGLVVLSAYSEMQRGNDAAFGFEQEANFWWLTGIREPDWWVIIDGLQEKAWLVTPTISDSHKLFDGNLSTAEAQKISGIKHCINRDEATMLLRDHAKKHSVAYSLADHSHAEHFDFVVNPAQKKIWQMLERTFTSVKDCRLELAKLRAIKQPDEIKAIKKAIKITSDAFEYVTQKLPELHYEYEVEAEFSYYFRMHGADGHAYDPIVAGGKNACVLHYGNNSDKLKKSSLLLLDIGARIDGYAADITRTYQIGEATIRQQTVSQAVQKAQKAIIALLKPGLSVESYHDQVDIIMHGALDSLGLLKNEGDYRRYFPHAISHGLGVDVHDALGQPTEFLAGMVITVEPGIYIPEESIGVRIEDNILITPTGHTNLSAHLSTGL
jgi:Xaa-Pro aminopeptidase